MKDYYKILEIQPDASLEVMNNAYRALVRKYHPDLYHIRMKAPMNAKMQDINEAYNTLSVAATRAEYDRRYQHRQPEPIKQSIHWKTVVLWGLGSFFLIKFFLKPILFSPLGRILLLGLSLYLIFKLISRTAPKR